jgi:hypothetical protein
MGLAPALAATLKFAVFEAAVLGASIRASKGFGTDRWLAILAIDIVIEGSIAQALSFTGLNSAVAYWAIAVALALYGRRPEIQWPAAGKTAALIAGLAVPMALVAFRPVDEIDSVNYLHYLIEWMGNRATPYSFATYYVAFWELSFLPVWTVTGVDLFFPALAAKAVALVALAAWHAGRELDVRPGVLAWTAFGAVTMRHYWLEHSGIATLKNDAAHGAGFLILLLVVMRAARRRLEAGDIALFGLGLAFSGVKYSGMFTGAIAAAAIVWLARDRRLFWAVPVFLLTSGHYYVRSLIRFGNPFYPFQINVGPIRLPGEADLSYTSILHHARDPQVWRLLFAPEGGVSPAGLLFPAILAATLATCAWRIVRPQPSPQYFAALLIASGWLLYFRSVYSASAGHDDLTFLTNSLNSLRYVDGLLAASEVWLAAMLGRFALAAIAINTASRLALVYARLPFPPLAAAALAFTLAVVVWTLRKHAAPVVASAILVACPTVVERNRERWTTYWNGLRPALDAVRGPDLAAFAMDEGSFFAGHVVAAGNPVHPEVRAYLPEEMDALPEATRPRYLAVLVTPGSNWRPKYGARLSGWGYRNRIEVENGAILERDFR